MKKFLWILLFGLAGGLAWAQGGAYATYYRTLPVAMVEPQQPVIPDNSLSLTQFGGVPDGLTDNTEAFAKAVAALVA